jgi:hypothetical protein
MGNPFLQESAKPAAIVPTLVSRKKTERIEVAGRAPQNLARLVITHRFTREQNKTIVMFNGTFLYIKTVGTPRSKTTKSKRSSLVSSISMSN